MMITPSNEEQPIMNSILLGLDSIKDLSGEGKKEQLQVIKKLLNKVMKEPDKLKNEAIANPKIFNKVISNLYKVDKETYNNVKEKLGDLYFDAVAPQAKIKDRLAKVEVACEQFRREIKSLNQEVKSDEVLSLGDEILNLTDRLLESLNKDIKRAG